MGSNGVWAVPIGAGGSGHNTLVLNSVLEDFNPFTTDPKAS